jgi:hypothetical protein
LTTTSAAAAVVVVVVVVVKCHLDGYAEKTTVNLLMNSFIILFTFIESVEPSRLGKRLRSFRGL